MPNQIKFMLLGILVLILFLSVFAMFKFRALQKSFLETQSPKIESQMRLYIIFMTILIIALSIILVYVILYKKLH